MRTCSRTTTPWSTPSAPARTAASALPARTCPGASSATDFVAWYNGHPDHAGDGFDLSQRRAVIIGNGNVALDVARILTATRTTWPRPTSPASALRALRASRIEEVVIVGRRGIGQSAFTVPEFAGLLAGLISTSGWTRRTRPVRRLSAASPSSRSCACCGSSTRGGRGRQADRAALPGQPGADHRRRTRHRRGLRPQLAGDRRRGSVRTEPTGETFHLDAGLVLTSIGYRGVAVDGAAVRRVQGVDPQRRRPGGRCSGLLRHRMDQARPERLHRHQQVLRATDGHGARRRLQRRVAGRARDEAVGPGRAGPQPSPALVDRAGWRAIDELERAAWSGPEPGP